MFDIGMQELILIFVVALLVFGPKRLPELGRTIGKGMAELKKAMYGVKEQMDSELSQIKDTASSTDNAGKTEKEAAAKDSKEKGAE
ncbi:MAG: twin-arginine translocase subunit TatB [Nitrospiraceae bacterium]|nr:MAG: twin-arginine translocase subunit TatB [Nitrospiraceae bacterium]